MSLARRLAPLAFLVALVAPPGAAQDPVQEFLKTVQGGETIRLEVLPEVVEEPVAEEDGAEDEGAEDEGGEGAQPAAIVAAFKKEKLERDTDAVFRAREELATRAAAQPEASEELEPKQRAKRQASELALRCLAGDWGWVSARIAEEQPGDAGALYAHLVAALSEGDTVCLPEEVLAVADAAPAAPRGADLANLGKLLRAARGRGGDRALERDLDGGTRWFGGTDPIARHRAGNLLIAAEAYDVASAFLPKLPKPSEDGVPRSPDLLRMHALVTFSQAKRAETYAERTRRIEEGWAWLDEASRAPGLQDRQVAKLVEARELAAGLVDPERVQRWRASLFSERSGREGAKALRALIQPLEQAQQRNRPAHERLASWRRVHDLTEALLTARDVDLDGWRTQLSVVTRLILHEVRKTREFEANQRRNSGNFYFGSNNQASSAADLVEALPSLTWLRTLDRSQGRELAFEVVGLLAGMDEIELAHRWLAAGIEVEPSAADELVTGFLKSWVGALDPTGRSNSGVESFNPFGSSSVFVSGGVTYFTGSRPQDFGQGLPVTRARQEAALDRLTQGIERFAALGVDTPDPSALVEVFAACHSPAEVYAAADIERVFGPLEALPGGVAAALSSAMRQRLAKQWRDSKTFEAVGTRRSSEEIEQENQRGYQLARRLASRALAAEPDSWNYAVADASVAFEHAEYQYSLDPELESYAPLRESAFAKFAAASQLYGASFEEGRSAPSATVHLAWFQSALGASESGYLTRETQPDVDQVERVRAALDALGSEAAEQHAGLFAESAAGELARVPAEAKQRFARHAARVAGDHPDAASLRRLLAFYDDLTREVELVAELDGSSEVGSDRPFGLRLWLGSSSAIAREAGGFARYLQNQVSTPSTNAPVDYLDRFEVGLREALFEGFEVDGIQFLPPESPARSFGRAHWERKPLAYLVLRAKDPAVDRIPSLQIDLDFSDGQGFVALAVRSTPVLIDAKGAGAGLELEEPAFEFTLDDRELDEGRVTVEARVTAFGAIPPAAQLLQDLAVPGFGEPEIVELPLNLIEIDPERAAPAPLAERTATLSYAASGEGDGTFRMPRPRAGEAEVLYRRYVDMDIATLDGPGVALGSAATERTGWAAWGVLLGLLLISSTLFSVLGRSGGSSETSDPDGPPVRPSPLSAVAYLERIERERGARLEAGTAAELRAETNRLREAFFAPSRNGHGAEADAGDLGELLRGWDARTR